MIDIVKLARDSIKSFFSGEKVNFPKDSPKRGVFITLYKRDDLRGCIGYSEPILPLYEAIFESSRNAAFEDPRFPHLEESELKQIRIEVSVLTPPELIKVKSPDDYLKIIKVGEDGLIVESDTKKGLLLPQVAVEYGWSSEEFLEHTCMKAGLSTDAWKDKKVKVFRFGAKIYKE